MKQSSYVEVTPTKQNICRIKLKKVVTLQGLFTTKQTREKTKNTKV